MQRHRKNVQIYGWLLITAMVMVLRGFAAGQQIITGNGQDGSSYEIAVPAQWNGDLVLYAHGINDPQEPLVVPSQDSDFAPFRDGLVALGYAVASSSWSTNGYAVKDGVQRTHQLKGIFVSQFGKPNRTILIGKSLGGLVVVKLAEQYPSQYDGVLSLCGAIGGGTPEIKYLADERAAFDYFFPGAVPGDAFHTPLLDFNPAPPRPIFLSAYFALLNGFTPQQDFKTLQFARVAKLDAISPAEIIQTALEGVGFSVRFDTDLLERTHGGIPYDNTLFNYSGTFNDATYTDAALNAGIERFASDPQAVNFVQKYYDPTGNLQIPMLTLHTVRDPRVPNFHEGIYAGLAAQAGASGQVVQQTLNRFGHCAFGNDPNAPQGAYTDADPTLKLNAFAALAKWIANAANKPQGGELVP